MTRTVESSFWKHPELTLLARLPARATFQAIPGLPTVSGRRSSQWYKSLNGELDFRDAPNPAQAERWRLQPKGKRESISVLGNLEYRLVART